MCDNRCCCVLDQKRKGKEESEVYLEIFQDVGYCGKNGEIARTRTSALLVNDAESE